MLARVPIGEMILVSSWVSIAVTMFALVIVRVGGRLPFNAALEAGAQDISRSGRGVDDEAFPAGRDATASRDVSFRNAQGTALVIDASGNGSSVTVKLWGTPEYDVRISTSPRTDIRAPRTRVVTTAGCTPFPGEDGFTVRVTRQVTRGDEQISTDAFASTYAARDRVECRTDGLAAPDEHSEQFLQHFLESRHA